MIRWITAHWGLKLIALLMALGIVFIKAQERIASRVVRNIQLEFENIPPNFRVPPNWFSPMIQIEVFGPKNIIDSILSSESSFRVDAGSFPFQKVPSEIPVTLTPDMFRTNLDTEAMRQFWIDNDSTTPQRIVLHTRSWNIEQEQPEFSADQADISQYEMPLYRLEKAVPIIVPITGTPPFDVKYQGYSIEPETVLFTGRREALEQLQSVSTTTLDLNNIRGNTFPVFTPLNVPANADVMPVNENIREATVIIHASQK